METKSTTSKNRAGLLFAVLTAFAVVLGFVVPGIAPAFSAETATSDETGDAIVTKTFNGITESEIPNVTIILTDENGNTISSEYAEPVETDGPFAKAWKFTNLPVGVYNITEENAAVEGYDLSATLGQLEVMAPTWTITDERDTPNDSTVRDIALTEDQNSFVAVDLTKGEGVIVITVNKLSVAHEKMIEEYLRSADGPFKNIDKGLNFYSIEEHGNEITAPNGGTFKFTPGDADNSGTINIGDESHWTQILNMYLAKTKQTAEAAVSNEYTEKPTEPTESEETTKPTEPEETTKPSEPEETTEPVVEPTKPEEPKKELPKTGVSTGIFAGSAALLLVAGATLVGLRRKL